VSTNSGVNYADAGHRNHAIHKGEEPTTLIARGPAALRVTLDHWGPKDDLFSSIYDALVANWGEHPSRTVDRQPVEKADARVPGAMNMRTGWAKLNDTERGYVEACFAGRTLQQVLERITFSFCVDGCTRAETHQIVRTRVGAGFMQHGGRDNDWRHRGWTMPETLARACDLDELGRPADNTAFLSGDLGDRQGCVIDWTPIDAFIHQQDRAHGLRGAIQAYLDEGKALYGALVDAGIPWQDARRLLWMGTQTYIHCDYNYVALRGVLGNRLEHVMDWEVNCVAQLMLREVRMKCPPLMAYYLGSHSDMAKVAKFAGLESWPPDGKWPVPPAQRDLPRQHTAVQMPFWVLTPAAMNGGDIEWIATNGTYPHEAVAASLASE